MDAISSWQPSPWGTSEKTGAPHPASPKTDNSRLHRSPLLSSCNHNDDADYYHDDHDYDHDDHNFYDCSPWLKVKSTRVGKLHQLTKNIRIKFINLFKSQICHFYLQKSNLLTLWKIKSTNPLKGPIYLFLCKNLI